MVSYFCPVLKGSYSACMGYLMKFPGGFDDVYRYVKTALIMRQNKVKCDVDPLFIYYKKYASKDKSGIINIANNSFYK